MKEIDFSTHAIRWSRFLTIAHKTKSAPPPGTPSSERALWEDQRPDQGDGGNRAHTLICLC